MTKAKQSCTCAICLDEIKPEDKGILDSCDHFFCFECIKTWVTDCENSCPLCKKPIKSISSGQQVFQVPEKKLGFENVEFFFCQVCRLSIVWEEFESNNAATGAELCDDCTDQGIHLRCMTDIDRNLYRNFQMWLC